MHAIFFTYVLVFANGKLYVGMSRTDNKGVFTRRYNNHKRDAANGKDLPVYHAWRKYGAPELVVLDQFETRQLAADAEIQTIRLLDATNPAIGYNLLRGGQGLNAPKGSAAYELMRVKVWENPERRAKCSAALKGRVPSEETLEGARRWLENGGAKERAARISERYKNDPALREASAARTRAQMTPEAREHLRKTHTGRADPRSEDGKRRHMEKLAAYMATPEAKEASRRGHQTTFSDPANVAKRDEGLAKWRASEENRRNCQRIAALSAKACVRAVRDKLTGIEYPSQRAMAQALGVSDSAITYRIRAGTAERINAVVKDRPAL